MDDVSVFSYSYVHIHMNTYIFMKVKALFWTGTREQKLYLRWGRKKHLNYNDLDRWQLRFNAKADWFFFLKPKLVCVFREPTSTRVNKNYSEVWTNNLPCLKSDVMYCCGERAVVILHVFCIFFHSNMKVIGSSGAGTLIYHTKREIHHTLAREKIKASS